MTAPAPNTATVLALERTRVAYERTMMAWVRTGTSLITFGFSVYKFFQLEIAARVGADMQIGTRGFGLALLVIGLLSLLVGTIEHGRDLRWLGAQYPDMPRSFSRLVAAVMSLLGLAALIAVVLNA
ncbi:MAG: DUF202 domain-containing protein [Burkholderiaceae bacterium]|jgi:putative membrane protein|nr:DUF202 domain-containing protein [Burkholderiaceae bacterium]